MSIDHRDSGKDRLIGSGHYMEKVADFLKKMHPQTIEEFKVFTVALKSLAENKEPSNLQELSESLKEKVRSSAY